jgi:hypothetical protein
MITANDYVTYDAIQFFASKKLNAKNWNGVPSHNKGFGKIWAEVITMSSCNSI